MIVSGAGELHNPANARTRQTGQLAQRLQRPARIVQPAKGLRPQVADLVEVGVEAGEQLGDLTRLILRVVDSGKPLNLRAERRGETPVNLTFTGAQAQLSTAGHTAGVPAMTRAGVQARRFRPPGSARAKRSSPSTAGRPPAPPGSVGCLCVGRGQAGDDCVVFAQRAQLAMYAARACSASTPVLGGTGRVNVFARKRWMVFSSTTSPPDYATYDRPPTTASRRRPSADDAR